MPSTDSINPTLLPASMPFHPRHTSQLHTSQRRAVPGVDPLEAANLLMPRVIVPLFPRPASKPVSERTRRQLQPERRLPPPGATCHGAPVVLKGGRVVASHDVSSHRDHAADAAAYAASHAAVTVSARSASPLGHSPSHLGHVASLGGHPVVDAPEGYQLRRSLAYDLARRRQHGCDLAGNRSQARALRAEQAVTTVYDSRDGVVKVLKEALAASRGRVRDLFTRADADGELLSEA